jgi:maltose O-acetyltransferase
VAGRRGALSGNRAGCGQRAHQGHGRVPESGRDPPGRVRAIGARTFVNYNLTALDVARITIGEDCQIGPNVQLLTPTHPVEPQPRRDKLEAALPIVIGNNVWLGGGAIVCPGVTIGDNAVIGAGAVVTKDVPANVVAVGNPARPVRNF